MDLPSLEDLRQAIRFAPEEGSIWLNDQRMLLLHASAFNALRSELIDSLGLERAKGLLMRMGHQAGRNDAAMVTQLRPHATPMEAFAVGPQLHTLEGIVRVEPIRLEMDRATGSFFGEFLWLNSFEAQEHIRTHGIHSEPVCWSQIGYASGYTSAFMGKEIVYKEVECIGKGDKHCRIIGKPIGQWEDAERLRNYFSAESLAETLLQLSDKVQNLQQNIAPPASLKELVNASPAIAHTLDLLRKAAQTDVGVLFLGETGTGKDTYARILHSLGQRREAPFVSVNCAALPRDLVEAELFGVEKGAFTGAAHSRAGRFERAHGGTIFLDEIGEMDLDIQSKLLRVLQTGELERVGDTRTRKVDVRIIAATNVPLEERVAEGRFRADLFYRLNVFPIHIPPLRERKEDIPALTNKFVGKFNAKHGKSVTGVMKEVLDAFMEYDWPGNIRELENLIERGVILTENGQEIHYDSVSTGLLLTSPASSPGGEGQLSPEQLVELIQGEGLTLEQLEQDILEQALKAAGGNYSAAARLLGMTAPQYRYRMKKKQGS